MSPANFPNYYLETLLTAGQEGFLSVESGQVRFSPFHVLTEYRTSVCTGVKSGVFLPAKKHYGIVLNCGVGYIWSE